MIRMIAIAVLPTPITATMKPLNIPAPTVPRLVIGRTSATRLSSAAPAITKSGANTIATGTAVEICHPERSEGSAFHNGENSGFFFAAGPARRAVVILNLRHLRTKDLKFCMAWPMNRRPSINKKGACMQAPFFSMIGTTYEFTLVNGSSENTAANRRCSS
jgi:hypothetical protein